MKLNMKVYIFFWIFLNVECWGFKTDPSAKRCKAIESFHGGVVQYLGERKRGSSAFYGCKDGYHLSPIKVESSTCTDVFEWDPVPPQCLSCEVYVFTGPYTPTFRWLKAHFEIIFLIRERTKMARVEKPENGIIKSNKDILLHDESYLLKCRNGYELYSEENGYIDRRTVRIRNKNGTLEPKSPKCEEKRCDPADQYKAIVKYTNGSSVTSKISSRTKVRLECEKGYAYYRGDKLRNTPLTRRCVKGNIEFAPVCKEVSCLVSGFQSNTDTYHREYQTPYFLVEGLYITAKRKLEVLCTNEDDFELFVNSTASYLVSFTTECRYGRFDVEADEFPICVERRCHFKPSQDECYTTNGKEECLREEFKVPSRTNVTLKCQEGYRLNRSEDEMSEHEIDEVQITCTKGSYFKGYKCIPDDRCKLKILEGSEYHLNETLIETDGRFPHGTQVDLQCLDDFDTFDEEDNFVNDANRYPHMTCYQGIWKYMYKCKKRCDTFNVTNGEIINKGENITANMTVVHGDSIIVRCGGSQDNNSQMKCDNGEWKGVAQVDCNDERTDFNADDVSENITHENMTRTPDTVGTTSTNGCLLPSSQKFIYRDENDMKISEGSFIGNGATLTVRCATFDYFDYLTSYDDDDNNVTRRTVTCINGEISSFELDCPGVEPASCMELQNGVVKKSFNLYIVSCDEGFSLNLIIPEKSECTCQNGELRSTIGNQIPECIQNNCVLPYDVDEKLSVKDRSRVLSLSAGSTVVSGDHVYMNCSKVTEGIYEPLNRRFKCVKGRWIEDEKDPKWVFGNDGEFPKCRQAICEPNCTNRGVCYKDDNCRCKHLTQGKRCEIVWCDKQCLNNNGSCVTPGKCSCPEGRYGPNCENKSCILPENSAKPKVPKKMYNIGDTLKEFECDFGYILSSKDGMTCQEDGSWSNIIQCVKNQCSVPEVKNAVLETKKAHNHLDKIRVMCDKGHHFDEYNSKVFTAVCRFGNWSRGIPTRCWPDSCELKIHEGSKHFLNGMLIGNVRMLPHSSHVGLQCLDNFDTFDEKNNIVNDTSIYPHMICYQGNWTNMYKCKKRCNTFNITNGKIINKERNITSDQAVVHGDSIIVSCEGSQDNDFQMKCDNGEWQGSVDCSDERKKINADDVSENATRENMSGTTETINTTTHTNGCLLLSDQKFTYRDENDIAISHGSFIGNGTTWIVGCATFDYDNYDNNMTEATVTCFDGVLSRFDLDCPEADPASCMKLQNGVVKKFLNWYTVSCYEGFSLNLIQLEKSEYTCQNGELRSTIGNQIPECIQNNCVLPDDIDYKLSVTDRTRDFSLSAGSTVVSGDHVYLNCSKVIEGFYEPLDRRFQCVKGQWKEDDEKDPNWVLGNNTKFPKCRQAICEPNCTNGGVCYKDDNCRCKHLTEGKRCEIVLCDKQCINNNGSCVTPGKCSCPEGRYGPNCENILCNEQCADNGGRCVTPTLCSCPEGRYGPYCEKNKCVNTFGKENDWYPRWTDLQNPLDLTKYIDKYEGMSGRACQQKCAELTDFQCMSVFYMKHHHTCWGFSTADKRYFHTNRRNWKSVVYIRSCGQTI